MKGVYAFVFVLLLIAIAFAGGSVSGVQYIFAVVFPYIAFIGLLAGFAYKIVKWAKSPVPFRIPTTCGQQKTLPWIKPNNLESPHNMVGLLGRMALEVLLFRSLFRNTKSNVVDGKHIHGTNIWLWLGGLAFHYSFLVIFLRHFRFFTEPVPKAILMLQTMDSMIEVHFLVPVLYLSDVVLLAAATYLFLRRVVIPQVNYISQVADYFPLFLILAIATTGVLMRYAPDLKVDLLKIKELVISLITFKPKLPEGISSIFFIHLFLVNALMVYFPLSKLMHLGGVFLSPTRNLVNNSRAVRHINPWNYPVKTHTYEEWEDDYREKLKTSGIPLDKE